VCVLLVKNGFMHLHHMHLHHLRFRFCCLGMLPSPWCGAFCLLREGLCTFSCPRDRVPSILLDISFLLRQNRGLCFSRGCVSGSPERKIHRQAQHLLACLYSSSPPIVYLSLILLILYELKGIATFRPSKGTVSRCVSHNKSGFMYLHSKTPHHTTRQDQPRQHKKRHHKTRQDKRRHQQEEKRQDQNMTGQDKTPQDKAVTNLIFPISFFF
jgi:hypothetical protein